MITTDYNTRKKDKLVFPNYKFDYTRNGLLYTGIKILNRLPQNITSTNDHTFNKSLKKFLIENSFYSLKEFFNGIW